MPLVQLALAFMVLTVFVTVELSSANHAGNTVRVNNAVTNVLALRNNVHDGYRGRSDYTGITIAVADNNGWTPNSLQGGRGPLNTTLQLADAGDRQFNIIIGNLTATDNQTLCQALATKQAGAWQESQIDGTPVDGLGIQAIVDACKSADTITLRSY